MLLSARLIQQLRARERWTWEGGSENAMFSYNEMNPAYRLHTGQANAANIGR